MCFKALVSIIGLRLAREVCAKLHGRRVTIGKKTCGVRDEYLQMKEYYDSKTVKEACALLGCTVRYFKHIRMVSNRGV